VQKPPRKLVRGLVAAAILIALAVVAWIELKPSGYGDGFVSGNGRIEATEINVATKLGGRVARILVDEGDFVDTGDVLAEMDTTTLQAQLQQAQAQSRQAENAIQTAQALVSQRESEHATAEALLLQRQAESNAAQKRYDRIKVLVQRNAMSRQQLDDAEAALQSAQAAVASARAQILSAEAGIAAARSQVIGAESALDAARAAVDRIAADITDSTLSADRHARVQFRTVEPGEVLGAGGRVLNLVDLTDVYMTFFLPERLAGRVAMGSDARIIIDAAPEYVIPATVSYVSSVAQFTPKSVETEQEREKMMFRIRARIDPALLEEHIEQVKTGLPGVAWLKLDADADWPAELEVNVGH